MVLKLYGMAKSTCTLRVATVLKEKEVPFEFVPVNLQAGEHKSPAYLEKQPFGQVPYVVNANSSTSSLALSLIAKSRMMTASFFLRVVPSAVTS